MLGADLFAYVAGIVAHSGYTVRFRNELQAPGIRVPLSGEPDLWSEAVAVGQEVVWLHTFGQRFADANEHRPIGPPRLPSDQRPKVVSAIPDDEAGMPDDIGWAAESETLLVGAGRISPVPRGVWEYEVSGMRVVRHWFGYRQRDVGRKNVRSEQTNVILRQTNVHPGQTNVCLRQQNVGLRQTNVWLRQTNVWSGQQNVWLRQTNV